MIRRIIDWLAVWITGVRLDPPQVREEGLSVDVDFSDDEPTARLMRLPNGACVPIHAKGPIVKGGIA
jgi:hypothetical protein